MSENKEAIRSSALSDNGELDNESIEEDDNNSECVVRVVSGTAERSGFRHENGRNSKETCDEYVASLPQSFEQFSFNGDHKDKCINDDTSSETGKDHSCIVKNDEIEGKPDQDDRNFVIEEFDISETYGTVEENKMSAREGTSSMPGHELPGSDGSGVKGFTDSEYVNAALLNLMHSTGYPIKQENGQRIFGPPTSWNHLLPSKNCEVFVGRLPRVVTECDLVPLFNTCGVIYQLRVMVDFSGNNRGFAFVKFSCEEEASRAISRFNNFEIKTRCYIGVVLSVDNCRLYVGGLPKSRSVEEVESELSRIIAGVASVFIYASKQNKKMNRGFAFVEFVNHRAAAVARRNNMPHGHTVFGRQITMDWAEPEILVDHNIMKKVKALHVRNLSNDTDEMALRKAFSKVCGFSAMEKVRKVEDYAFVHFQTRESAENVLTVWNGKYLAGCKLYIDWAKPVSQDEYLLHKAMSRYYREGLPDSPNEDYFFMGGKNCNDTASRTYRCSKKWRGQTQCYARNPRMNKIENKIAALSLLRKCEKFNFGTPMYQYFVVKRSEFDSADGRGQYICRIFLPNCFGTQLAFQAPGSAASPAHAQLKTCEFLTKVLRQGNLLEAALKEISVQPPVHPLTGTPTDCDKYKMILECLLDSLNLDGHHNLHNFEERDYTYGQNDVMTQNNTFFCSSSQPNIENILYHNPNLPTPVLQNLSTNQTYPLDRHSQNSASLEHIQNVLQSASKPQPTSSKPRNGNVQCVANERDECRTIALPNPVSNHSIEINENYGYNLTRPLYVSHPPLQFPFTLQSPSISHTHHRFSSVVQRTNVQAQNDYMPLRFGFPPPNYMYRM